MLPLISPLTFEVVNTVAVWIELFIYGIYTTLFITAMLILRTKKVTGTQNGTLVFLYTAVLMYVLATLHMALALFRYLNTYTFVTDPLLRGWELFNFRRWDTILSYAIFSIMTWLGDGLVIYRCYIVWNKSFRIIMLPVLMLITFIALGLVIVVYTTRPHISGVFPVKTLPSGIFQTMYPLVVAQNILTTGLIGFKIWQQHRLSASHGIVDRSSPLSLLRILRIIIESALIYTLQVVLFTILFFCKSPAQIVVQNMIMPSLGIVFVLMSLRVHHAKENSTDHSSTLPRWLDNTTNGVQFSDQMSFPAVGVVSLRVSGESLPDRNVILLEPLPSSSSSRNNKIKGDVPDL